MCECRVCTYGKKVNYNLSKIPEDQKNFFMDMYNRLCNSENDYEYLKFIKIPEMEKLNKINEVP